MQEPKLTVHILCYIIIKVQGSRFGRDFFSAVPTRSQNNPAKQNFCGIWLVYPRPQKQLGVSKIRQKMLANFSLKGNY